jgi:uncharacterized protein
MNERIVSELRTIEGQLNVRVLLAVESGSRAWGFASLDSDYDVRFVYVHARDWYLAVHESRDVIEQMLPGDLDLGGWELRKTLRLFERCNLALNEWIGSPIVYWREARFHERIAQLLPRFFNPIAGMHHYRRMAQAALESGYGAGGIGIKKLFYVLRPLLACRWILNARSQPPTEFAQLVEAAWVTAEERVWIAGLLREKAVAVEAQPVAIAPSRIAGLRAEIAAHEAAASAVGTQERESCEELDAVLREWIR